VIGPLAGMPVYQLGFVYEDLDRAVERLGGEWGRFDLPADAFRDVAYRGEPAPIGLRLALAGSAPQLELIQPGEGPSVYRDWLDERGEGLQHLTVEVESVGDVVPALEAAGYPCVYSGGLGSGEFALFDTTAELGVFLEALKPPRSSR
jgi:hypothetical protein